MTDQELDQLRQRILNGVPAGVLGLKALDAIADVKHDRDAARSTRDELGRKWEEAAAMVATLLSERDGARKRIEELEARLEERQSSQPPAGGREP